MNGTSVLIVEDESLVARDLEASLSDMGYDVFSPVASSDEALRAAEARRPDVVLMDIRIKGGRDGISTAELLRDRFQVPVVFLTAYTDDETLARAARTQPYGYLVKPISAPQVRSALEVARERHRAARSERLAALGALAGGAARELNNPLAFLIANTEILADCLGRLEEGAGREQDGSRLWREASQALNELRRGETQIGSIVGELKVFARPVEGTRTRIDPRASVEWALRMTAAELQDRARVVKRLDPTPPVLANESRLGQAFVQLLTHAARAIPDDASGRGEIHVITGTDASGRAAITVRDSGRGMRKELIARLFDPFFTPGTGLGLSICERIVRALGGEIHVESEPGAGSVFHVVLPPAATIRPAGAAVRRGRILVIDDEAPVLGSIRRLLGEAHDLTTLTSVPEALELIASGRAFDLVLCDLVMPGPAGMELYGEVQARFPALAARIVFVSGGMFSPQVTEFLTRVPNPRVDKPFDLDELEGLLRRMLPTAG